MHFLNILCIVVPSFSEICYEGLEDNNSVFWVHFPQIISISYASIFELRSRPGWSPVPLFLTGQSCPNHPDIRTNGASCYFFLTDQPDPLYNQQGARSYCQNSVSGGSFDLLKIDSQAEQAYIKQIIMDGFIDFERSYLGVQETVVQEEDTYKWLMGKDCHLVTHGPLTRYLKLRVAHAPGMPGTFSPPPRVTDTDMHHGTCLTHVSWCIPGSLSSGFLRSRWRGKRSRHSRRMRNQQFYVSCKRPIGVSLFSLCRLELKPGACSKC